ncbi:MAG: hypothetical protein QNJ47_17835 [Nostocaceae cyanobacterium]|nr:hypothetical protein [Nostocaceae cyanobacterium]
MILTLLIAWFIFTLLVKVIKTTVKTAFLVAAVIVLLQIGYNISPLDILNYIIQFSQSLSEIIGGK